MEKKDTNLLLDNNIEHLAGETTIRMEKVRQLNEKGINPWPSFKPVSALSKAAIEEFKVNPDTEKEYSFSGRLISKREHGKTMFAHIQDTTGKLQIYLKQDVLGGEAFEFVQKFIDIGDIVWVRGTLFETKSGEITLKVFEISLMSKCLHPLAEKYHGLVDIEQRYRQRYLDLICNDESREKFRKRSKIIESIRYFLTQESFLEVETPMLHPIPGGAAARPFITHHNTYDMDLYLRIAPELYLKRLVIGGFERVFEINRNFRNEGISTRHNPEFTMLEFYMANGDYKTGMSITEDLMEYVVLKNCESNKVKFGEHEIDFTKPFARMSIVEALRKIANFSEKEIDQHNIDELIQRFKVKLNRSNASYGEKLFALFEETVEKKLIQPTFITGHPIEVSPLAKRDPENPYAAARFELYIGGVEVANGFTELNDPFDQAERFKKQVEASEFGDEEAHHYDSDYIHALEYGLPPAVGVGIGIDRFVMMLTNTTSIKDVILFPTLKQIKNPTNS